MSDDESSFEEGVGKVLSERFDEPPQQDEQHASQAPSEDNEEAGPWFSYEDAETHSVYVSKDAGTWTAYDIARDKMRHHLVEAHGLIDVEKRELDDAALSFIAEHVEEVADRVVEAREK